MSAVKKLVRYYKNDFKFYECDESMKLVKPDYDNYCYGLVQQVNDLKKIGMRYGKNFPMYGNKDGLITILF